MRTSKNRIFWLCLAAMMLGVAGFWGCDDDDSSGGAWKDSASGLTWQDPPSSDDLTWEDAKAYCDDLDFNGHGDWRLPTISELRSLIRGCPDTQTGGACSVTDSCLQSTCGSSCNGCSSSGGPGTGVCYWDDALSGSCEWYWSSSPVADNANYAWGVSFNYGYVYYDDVLYSAHEGYRVRCVR